MTRKIQFMGYDLIVQLKDEEISMVLMNINGIYVSIGGILHPEYLEEIKLNLI